MLLFHVVWSIEVHMKIQPKIVPEAKRCHPYNYRPTCGSCPRQDPQSLFRWCSAREQNCWQHLPFQRSIAQDGTAGGMYQCELHRPPVFKNPPCRDVCRWMQTWKTRTRNVLSGALSQKPTDPKEHRKRQKKCFAQTHLGDSWLQVNHHASWHVLACPCLREEPSTLTSRK